MLASYISTSILNSTKKIAEDYSRAVPFPHIVIDNFLEPQLIQKLIEDFPLFQKEKAKNEMGEPSLKFAKEIISEISPSYKKLNEIVSSNEFLVWLSELTGIPNLLYDPSYFGGGTHENLVGQDLAPHIDFNVHPNFGWYRRLNFLLYLNPQWQEQSGGELELHENPWKPRAKEKIISIAPIANRLAIFTTSDHSWHGFEKITNPNELPNYSRKSIAMYFYTKEPPAHDLRFHHSTIYCERHIPDTVKVGEILSKKDYEEVLRLNARRDHLLQFLYERELLFSKTTSNLIDSLNMMQYFESAKINLEKDLEELLHAFKVKLNHLEEITTQDYIKKQNYPTTLFPSNAKEFVVARGSSNRKPFLMSGSTVQVDPFNAKSAEHGKKVLVYLDAILPNSATHTQFTICSILKKFADQYLLYHDDYLPARLYFVPESAIHSFAATTKNSFGHLYNFQKEEIPLTKKVRFILILSPIFLRWNQCISILTNKNKFGIRGIIYRLHKNIFLHLGLSFY